MELQDYKYTIIIIIIIAKSSPWRHRQLWTWLPELVITGMGQIDIDICVIVLY